MFQDYHRTYRAGAKVRWIEGMTGWTFGGLWWLVAIDDFFLCQHATAFASTVTDSRDGLPVQVGARVNQRQFIVTPFR
jgi:hypothetical protein